MNKNTIKNIRTLEKARARREQNLFLAEGPKAVGELLLTERFPLHALYGTREYFAQLPAPLRHLLQRGGHIEEVSAEEVARASLLQTPQTCLALFQMPQGRKVEEVDFKQEGKDLILLLDGVQDPGNLGTILRLCDWYGVHRVILSPDTADAFAPKVVQATMGALGRVETVRCEPVAFLQAAAAAGYALYGTHLEGTSLYDTPLASRSVLVMGNEGRGIRPETAAALTHRLFIPPYPADAPASAHVESLNVAVATAIAVAEIRRRG